MPIDSVHTRVAWGGTHAGIPGGWQRDTNFDEKFLQGDDQTYAAPANAGGAHDHGGVTVPHTHTAGAHSHSFSAVAAGPASGTSIKQSVSGLPDVIPYISPFTHPHGSITSPATQITYANQTMTVANDTPLPPYKKVIVIRPNNRWVDIPDDGICYTDEAVNPTGFDNHLLLSAMFARGAANGADADFGAFGSADHDHGGSTNAHTHTDTAHSHIAIASGLPPRGLRIESLVGAPTTAVMKLKHHNVSMVIKTLSDVSTDNTAATGTASNSPDYIKLKPIQNTSGAATTPIGVIAAFVGDVGAGEVPDNWQICDGNGDTFDCRDRQILGTIVNGEIGDTDVDDGVDTINNQTHTIAGAHGHTHTAAHNHTAHSGPIGGNLRNNTSPTNLVVGIIPLHTHVWNVTTTTPIMGTSAVTISAVDGRSAYRTVVWIKKLSASPQKPTMMSNF